MATTQYTLLPPAEEDNLHNDRLTSIEQRPFQRVAKRLLEANSMILRKPTSLPTPPPEGTGEAGDVPDKDVAQVADDSEERRRWREEMLLDFEVLESSMIRIQLLHRSNEKERQRYAAEKVKIIEQTERIKENTIELRKQLEEAQKTLALRKEYDELTEKILANRMLRSREDSNAQLDKLNLEISELERESEEYAQTWRERQEQFGRIVEAGKDMLRMIRDEKEEAERKEGMEMEDSEGAQGEGASTKAVVSTVGTPRPADLEGGATPLPPGEVGDASLLRPPPTPAHGSRATSPARSDVVPASDEAKDANMEESAPTQATSDSEMEEGEEQEDNPAEVADRMEVS